MAQRSMSKGGVFFLIDSTIPHIWLPRAVCNEFEKAFNLRYDPASDLYLVNNYTELRALKPGFTLSLGTDLEYNGKEAIDIHLPCSVSDLEASWPNFPQ